MNAATGNFLLTSDSMAVGTSVLIDALRRLVQDQIIQPVAGSQYDAWAAIRRFEQEPATSWFGERYAERWQCVATALRAAGALDGARQLAVWDGGPYAWYSWSAGPTSGEVFSRLLDEAQVAVCPAEALVMRQAAPIRAIRIGLGAEPDQEAFACVLARLAPVLATATASSVVPLSERILHRKRRIALVLQDKKG